MAKWQSGNYSNKSKTTSNTPAMKEPDTQVKRKNNNTDTLSTANNIQKSYKTKTKDTGQTGQRHIMVYIMKLNCDIILTRL